MLNIQAKSLQHRHGDHWSPMPEVAQTTSTGLDPERQLVRGHRVFSCTECGSEVSLESPESVEATNTLDR